MSEKHSDRAALRGEPGYVWRAGQDRRLQMIRRWVNLGGRILDNGCGLGTYLEAMQPFGGKRFGLELEPDRASKALSHADGVALGIGERLPFTHNYFDFVLSNEVIEHVANDAIYAAEMVRVTRPGGRIVIFCPNRWYPVEQHGIYWRGNYHFGNIPLVNYLPTPLRNHLAPHVRTYTSRSLRRLFETLPVREVHYSRIFGGYDNIVARWPEKGRLLRKILYRIEQTPLSVLALSHLLVLEKQPSSI